MKTEKELLGEVDVEKRFQDIINSETPQNRDEMLLDATKHGFKYGYKQALEDNKKKKYTEEELKKAIEYGYQLRNNNKPINSGIDWVKEFNSLNKQD